MQKKDAESYKILFNFMLKTALDNYWTFKMIEDGGSFLTDFEWAPHLAKNGVFSETPLIPGSKAVLSKGCNFHFSSGIMKDSKLYLSYFQPVGTLVWTLLMLFNLDNVKQRMKILYDKNDEHRADVKLLLMLVYIPTEDIPVII